jgi:hypothetical protein
LPNKPRDLDSAIADFNVILNSLESGCAAGDRQRGLAKQAKGDVDGAIADYNRAIELAAKLAKPSQARLTKRSATINKQSTNENNTDVDRWVDAAGCGQSKTIFVMRWIVMLFGGAYCGGHICACP